MNNDQREDSEPTPSLVIWVSSFLRHWWVIGGSFVITRSRRVRRRTAVEDAVDPRHVLPDPPPLAGVRRTPAALDQGKQTCRLAGRRRRLVHRQDRVAAGPRRGLSVRSVHDFR